MMLSDQGAARARARAARRRQHSAGLLYHSITGTAGEAQTMDFEFCADNERAQMRHYLLCRRLPPP